jgi:hypothetical protein
MASGSAGPGIPGGPIGTPGRRSPAAGDCLDAEKAVGADEMAAEVDVAGFLDRFILRIRVEDPVETEPGHYAEFYALLAKALRTDGPLPSTRWTTRR